MAPTMVTPQVEPRLGITTLTLKLELYISLLSITISDSVILITCPQNEVNRLIKINVECNRLIKPLLYEILFKEL